MIRSAIPGQVAQCYIRWTEQVRGCKPGSRFLPWFLCLLMVEFCFDILQ